MKRLFIDMNDVIVVGENRYNETPVPGAISAIREILEIGCCQVYIVPSLDGTTIIEYCNKFDWIKNNLNELAPNFIISHVMDQMADAGDMLITHEEREFPGILVDFTKEVHNWAYIIDIIEKAVEVEMP